MEPHLHDPVSVYMCWVEFVALLNHFLAYDYQNIEIRLEETGKE